MRDLNTKQGYKLLILLIAGIYSVSLTAQNTEDSVADYRKKSKPVIKLELGAATGSRGVNQYFLNRAIFGGYVSPANMDKSMKLLGNHFNAVGLNTVFGVRAENCIQRTKVVADGVMLQRTPWGLAFEQKMLVGSSFSPDFFKLVFKGNLTYEGQTLDLKNMRLKMLAYRKLSLIVNQKLIGKSKEKFTLYLNSASLVQSNAYLNLKAWDSRLYTAPWGDSVTGTLNGKWDHKNGTGVGAAIGLSGHLGKKWYYAINDLGVVFVPNVNTYSKEGNFAMHQQPLVRTDFIKEVFSNKIKDTLKRSLKLDSSSSSRTVFLPFNITLVKAWRGGKEIRISYLNMPGYLPEISYRAGVYPLYHGTENFALSMSPAIALGGYDSYNVNADFIMIFGKSKKWGAILDFRGIEGLVLSKYAHGSGLFLRMSYKV